MSEKIAKDQVVTFHYTLRDGQGEVLDQSVGSEPLAYLHGHHNIIPGLEVELEGKSVGDKLKVHVPPAKGYGDYDQEKCFQIPRKELPPVDIQPGMGLELHAEDGDQLMARVVAVNPDFIDVDANHPMAGKDLHFEVEVTGIRPATGEEVSHGHVHGPGGHHHH